MSPPEVQATSLDDHSSARTVPMEVLVLGLCRTSTDSMRVALQDLGYSGVYHMKSVPERPQDGDFWADALEAKFGAKGKPFGREEFDQVLGDSAAVTDAPACFFYEELMAAYPEAKIVLSVRDSPEAWHRSYLQSIHTLKAPFGPPNTYTQAIQRSFMRLIFPATPMARLLGCLFRYLLSQTEIPEVGTKFYIDHNAGVHAAAKRAGREVLEFNAKDGWKPLCEFLGKEVPKDKPFPRVNSAADFQKTASGLKKEMLKQSFFSNLPYMLMGLAAATGYGAWLWNLPQRMHVI